MCGRFTQAQIAALDREIFKLLDLPPVEPRYNIAPTDAGAVVREVGDRPGRRLDWLRWGLIPSWADDPGIGNRLINARAETVATRPAFRDGFERRRCLVPADGFYEWRRTPHGKQPYYIRLRDGGVFAFAGLWERYERDALEPVETFTIITTDANELLTPIHNRMPVILAPEEYDRWLDPAYRDSGRLVSLLKPYRAEAMTAYPVSRYVNDPRNEGPECIEPVELPGEP